MYYSLLTEDILLKRFESLPSHIQNIVSSEQAEKLISQIGKSHYLSKEKVQTLEQIVALILMGFVHLRNLKREISDKLFLNYDHTVALSNDLEQELFREIRGDLDQIYTPIEEDVSSHETSEENLVSEPTTQEMLPEKTEDADNTEINIPIREEKVSVQKPKDKNSPFMLVEEKTPEEETRGESSFKDFSKSFSFFAPKEDSSAKSPVRARVETPKDKKVVHYSELRSPTSIFDRGAGFINLKKPEKEGAPENKGDGVGVTEIKLKPNFLKTEKETETNPIVLKQEKNQTKDRAEKEVGIDGNKIDLRNI